MNFPSGRTARLALLLGVATAWRLILFVGPQGSDDLAYSEHARALASGEYRPVPDIFSLRIGYIGPMALVYAIAGAGPIQLVLVNLVASLAGIVLTFFVARRLVGERGAWIAAALMAAVPIDVHLATEAHTDMPLAALTTASVLFLLGARETGEARRFFAAGLALGLGHLVKESAFLALPVLLLLSGRSWRNILILLGGFSAPILLETFAYGACLGDPLFRITSTRAAQARAMQTVLEAQAGQGARLVDAIRSLFDPTRSVAFGWLVPLGAVGAAMALRGRERRLVPALLWSGIVLALLLLWPVTLVPYRPALATHARIFLIILPPTAVLAAYALLQFRSRTTARVATVLVGLSFAAGALLLHADARAGTAGALRAWSRLHGAAAVVSDPRTVGLFRLYDGYRGTRRWIDWDQAPPDPPALWVANDVMIGRLRDWYGIAPPGGFPPKDATLVFEERLPRRVRVRSLLTGKDAAPRSDRVAIYASAEP